MTEEQEDKPNVSLHPPTVFCIALVLGYTIRLFAGGFLALPEALAEGLGLGLMIFALAMSLRAVMDFAESGEKLPPATASRQLFTDGAFRYSRNPIYLSMMLFGVGFGLATLNLWIMLTTIAAGVVFNYFVIPQEEAYLARRFGVEYDQYRGRVRRWL